MKKTEALVAICSEKHKRAFNKLKTFLLNTYTGTINIQSLLNFENLKNVDFNTFSGVLYSFFEHQSILVSSYFYNTKIKHNKASCSWGYVIFIDGSEIRENNFEDRSMTELVAFTKAFQFLDTKLFIADTKGRFHDEASVVSCLNVNWSHLDAVLEYRRKFLINY